MLNVGKIENGIVLDHIHAGRGMSIYHHMELSKMECPVAIIKNARSNAMGKKDIVKIETDADSINLDVIAFIDPDITVNIIKDGELIEKKRQMQQSPLHYDDRTGDPAHVLPGRFPAQDLSL